MAGGTGGHIFPALAIAKELQKQNCNVQWLGSNNGMENSIIPKHHLPLHTISSVGLRGKRLSSLIKAPLLLTLASFQALKIILNIKPDVVLGMGGFASGVGGIIAWILRIPLVIHEQNAIAGSTNKLLTKVANKTFQAFDNTLKNATTSGNPILFSPKKHTVKNKKLNLLIVGGSLGSKPINEVVTNLNIPINIWHQTGKIHFNDVKSRYKNSTVKVDAFIDDMAKAYAWADIVLCRAGAMTVSELMLSATPGILIPLPHAIDNHQFFNAKILENNYAGILIEQKDLTLKYLEDVLLNLSKEKINSMSDNAKKLAKPEAAKQVSNYLITL